MYIHFQSLSFDKGLKYYLLFVKPLSNLKLILKLLEIKKYLLFYLAFWVGIRGGSYYVVF